MCDERIPLPQSSTSPNSWPISSSISSLRHEFSQKINSRRRRVKNIACIRSTKPNKPNQFASMWNALTASVGNIGWVFGSFLSSIFIRVRRWWWNPISSTPSHRRPGKCACCATFAAHTSRTAPSPPSTQSIRLTCSIVLVRAPRARRCSTRRKSDSQHSTNENVFPNTKLLFSKLLVLTKHPTETGYCVASFRLCAVFFRRCFSGRLEYNTIGFVGVLSIPARSLISGVCCVLRVRRRVFFVFFSRCRAECALDSVFSCKLWDFRYILLHSRLESVSIIFFFFRRDFVRLRGATCFDLCFFLSRFVHWIFFLLSSSKTK